MHVYRNRRYEEDIVMLKWHKKGEQKGDRNSQTENTDTGTLQDHRKRDTDTHTETNKNTQNQSSRRSPACVLRW
jgi:hypothetical protein